MIPTYQSQPDQTSVFSIVSLNQQYENNTTTNIERYPQCYRIIWLSNNIQQQNQGNNTDTKKMLLLLKPGQEHCYVHDTTGYVIYFSNGFLEVENAVKDSVSHNKLFQLLHYSEENSFPQNLLLELQEIIDRMYKEYHNSHLFSTEILQWYLKIFFLCLSRHFENYFQMNHQSRNMEIVQSFFALLDKRFKTQKMVAAYAKELFVTPNYLNEVIKKNTGFSAGHHIRHRIVLEAKKMARHSNMCMKEIAYTLDFADSAHFSKFFKSVTGCNFSTFKKGNYTLSIVA